MKINEVAKLTGVTVRTLHYYDEIGLLTPSKITESGYRIYDYNSLEKLQQILFFRELEFSLNDIKDIMQNPHYDKDRALNKHKALLVQKRNRLNDLIELVDNTIKGECDMSFKQFDMTEWEKSKREYAQEVKERWGDTKAYAESEKKTNSYDDKQWKLLNDEGACLLKEFGENINNSPASQEVQALVKRWQEYITANFYSCTKEILSCLGVMYIEDERFKKNIDRNGMGTAQLMADAIKVYCSK